MSGLTPVGLLAELGVGTAGATAGLGLAGETTGMAEAGGVPMPPDFCAVSPDPVP